MYMAIYLILKPGMLIMDLCIFRLMISNRIFMLIC